MSGKKRNKYVNAINRGKDAFIEAIAICSEDDRFLLSDNLIDKICDLAHLSESTYRNYFGSITDNSGNVYSKETKLITYALADMVFREEKYYSDIIAEYRREKYQDDFSRYKYIKKITEHVNENCSKYLFEIRSDRITLFRLFSDTILILYDQIPKADLPQFMIDTITNNRSRRLANLYFFWASRDFQDVALPFVQLKISEIFSKLQF